MFACDQLLPPSILLKIPSKYVPAKRTPSSTISSIFGVLGKLSLSICQEAPSSSEESNFGDTHGNSKSKCPIPFPIPCPHPRTQNKYYVPKITFSRRELYGLAVPKGLDYLKYTAMPAYAFPAEPRFLGTAHAVKMVMRL
jgi:hypothetical protein